MSSRAPGIPAPPNRLWKSSQAQVGGPAWSMKPRRTFKTTADETPAPNRYLPKRLIHSSSYSIGVRLKSEIELKDKAIPGAGKYNSRYAYKKLYDSLPQFTLRPRTPIYMPSKGIPAPNKYFPGPNPKQRFAPKYSMKPRLEVGSPMYSLSSNRRGPGPGAYNIKSCIAVQQYKIKFKSRHDLRDRSISPACNHYKPDRGSRPHSAHSYSMLFRRQVKNLAYESPGPIYNTLRPLGYRKPF